MLALVPEMTAFSALKTMTSSPCSARLAAKLASLPSTKFEASMMTGSFDIGFSPKDSDFAPFWMIVSQLGQAETRTACFLDLCFGGLGKPERSDANRMADRSRGEHFSRNRDYVALLGIPRYAAHINGDP